MSGQTFEELLAEIAAKPPTDAQLARALRRLEDRFTLLGRAAGMPQFGQELSRQLVDVAEALEARDAPKAAPEPAEDSSVLTAKDGPVVITLEGAEEDAEIARFATIADAETYLGVSASIDPDHLAAGRYGISAPHGVGCDDEAVRLARELGFSVFWSMGRACWAPKGVSVSGNLSGKGWRTGFETIEAASLAALASIPPD